MAINKEQFQKDIEAVFDQAKIEPPVISPDMNGEQLQEIIDKMTQQMATVTRDLAHELAGSIYEQLTEKMELVYNGGLKLENGQKVITDGTLDCKFV